MKSKKITLTSLLWLISLLAVSFSVYAASDDYKIVENTLYIYEIQSLNEELIEKVFVDDKVINLGENPEIGLIRAHNVTNIEWQKDYNSLTGTHNVWKVEFWYWNWLSEGWTDDEEDFVNPDESKIYKSTDIYVFENPVAWPKLITHSIPGILVFTGVPTPVSNYLANLRHIDSSDYRTSAEGNALMVKIYAQYDSRLDEDYIIWYVWNDQGEFEAEVGTTADNQIIYKVGLKARVLPTNSSSISGYELPFLLGAGGISILGIAILIVKRKLNTIS